MEIQYLGQGVCVRFLYCINSGVSKNVSGFLFWCNMMFLERSVLI